MQGFILLHTTALVHHPRRSQSTLLYILIPPLLKPHFVPNAGSTGWISRLVCATTIEDVYNSRDQWHQLKRHFTLLRDEVFHLRAVTLVKMNI